MRRTSIIGLAAAAIVASALAGCQAGAEPEPTVTADPGPTATFAPGEDDVPDLAPELHPDGTAAQNEQYFGAVVDQYFQAARVGTSQLLVDTLVAAGFDRSSIEVTYEYTAIGLAADSIEVSVRFGDECLIGSIRQDWYNVVRMPLLAKGTCLIGGTYPVG